MDPVLAKADPNPHHSVIAYLGQGKKHCAAARERREKNVRDPEDPKWGKLENPTKSTEDATVKYPVPFGKPHCSL